MKLCYFINNASYFMLHWLDRARSAQQAGYEIHLLGELHNQQQRAMLEKHGIACHPLSLHSASLNPLDLIIASRQALHILRQLQPDLVHCITLKPCLVGVWIARRSPTVLSFPGLGRLFSARHLFLRLFRRIVCKWWHRASRRPRCLLTFEHEKDRQTLCALAHIPFDCTRVTGVSGVDPDVFMFTPPPCNSPPVVLFATRLIRSKGLDILVRVCRQLRHEGTELILQVAGLPADNDPDAVPAEQIQAWTDSGDIVWLGACHDMPRLLASVDLVALPTRYAEGVPRILLEAAACGRPSVAFDRGGCSTVLQNNLSGILVADGDEAAFTDALRSLLINPVHRYRAGIAGRKQVTALFTAAEAAARMLRCYDELTDDQEPLALPVSLVMENK